MSTVLSSSTALLEGNHRAWLSKMGAALDIPIANSREQRNGAVENGKAAKNHVNGSVPGSSGKGHTQHAKQAPARKKHKKIKATATQKATRNTTDGNADPAKEAQRLGLHTLFLTQFNEDSVTNLIKLLKKTKRVVTLAIAPCFSDRNATKEIKAEKKAETLGQEKPSSKGPDTYKNVKTIIGKLYKARKPQTKVLSLTVFLSYHGVDTSSNSPYDKHEGPLLGLADHCKLLNEFLLEEVEPGVTYMKCLEHLAISPSLEDNYSTDDMFNQAVKVLINSLDPAVLKCGTPGNDGPKLEFRRSVGAGSTSTQHPNKDFKVGDVDVSVPVTREFHGKPGDAAGYDVYATDASSIYSDADMDGDGTQDEQPDNDALNGHVETVSQFVNGTMKDELKNQTEVVLWRPGDNLQRPKDKQGNLITSNVGANEVNEYDSSSDPYKRKDKFTAFNQLEINANAQFLGITNVPKAVDPNKPGKRNKAGTKTT